MGELQQSGPIAVYGATGYTGKLVATELKRRGADFVISGRSREKLEALSAQLGGVPSMAASVDDPAGLRSLLDPCAAVIACAGPFTLHGEPVLAAAAETGTHYIDTTGEQAFMKLVFDRYDRAAAESGAALVSGMGFDYVPGDMIASLTAAGLGPLDEITIGYWASGFGYQGPSSGATRGTMLSAMEVMRGGGVEWRDGALRQAPRSSGRSSFRFPAPLGERPMVRYPSGEQVTVPRHVQTETVRTLLSATTIAPKPLLPLLGVTMPAIGLAMRTPIRRAAGALIRRMPEGPDDEGRSRSRFVVVCEARAHGSVRRGTINGSNVYGLTAVTTVEGAVRAADPAYDRSGALAPAQAFDPRDFLASLDWFGVEFEVEALPEPVPAAH